MSSFIQFITANSNSSSSRRLLGFSLANRLCCHLAHRRAEYHLRCSRRRGRRVLMYLNRLVVLVRMGDLVWALQIGGALFILEAHIQRSVPLFQSLEAWPL